MQTSYSFDQAVGFPGLISGIGPRRIHSYANAEPIPFGAGVVQGAAANQCRLPQQNQATATFSADLVASNKINGQVNGQAIAEVTFDTDHLTTMGLIAAAIEQIDGVASATVGGTNNRTITVLAEDGASIALSGFAVTAGASQATVTLSHGTTDTLLGLAVHEHVMPTDAGVARYETNSAVNVMRQGTLWVTVETSVAPGDTPYLRFAPRASNTQLGAFRADSDSGTAIAVTGARFLTAASAGKLAQLEINLP